MFDSLLNVVKDTARIVTAPVEIVADMTSAVIKPIAEVAQDIVDDVKEVTK